MDRITQEVQVVNLLPHKDISTAAFTAAYVNMENYGHVDFIISIGANGAGTKAVTISEAINKSAGSAATITAFDHYYSVAAGVATKTTLASGTFNIVASTDNLTYVVPCDAAKLTDGFSHLGVAIAKTSAACICGCIALLSEPRYAQAVMPTGLD